MLPRASGHVIKKKVTSFGSPQMKTFPIVRGELEVWTANRFRMPQNPQQYLGDFGPGKVPRSKSPVEILLDMIRTGKAPQVFMGVAIMDPSHRRMDTTPRQRPERQGATS
jgi:hypothetical protein